MFPLFSMQAALQIWKINYCTSSFARCERYKLAGRGEPVADHMMPNGNLLKKGRK